MQALLSRSNQTETVDACIAHKHKHIRFYEIIVFNSLHAVQEEILL